MMSAITFRPTARLFVLVAFAGLCGAPSALAQSLETFAVLAGTAVTCTDSVITGDVGVYNVLNNSSVSAIQTAFGTKLFQPTTVLYARLLQLSARLDF